MALQWEKLSPQEFQQLQDLAVCCSINARSFLPIVVLNGTNEFLYPPTGSKELQIKAAAWIDIACPGSEVIVNKAEKGNFIQATCESGDIFKIQNGEGVIEVSWFEISCSAPVKSIVVHTSGSVNSTSKKMEIGFQISPGRFLRTITVSFNKIMQAPEYSYYTTSSIGQADQDTLRENKWWTPDGIYTQGISPDELYIRKTQQETINGLLGLDANSEKYISSNNKSQNFLSRGHLTARGDFFFGYQQTSTFYYINAAPQWQSFNGVNWQKMESDLRKYAVGKRLQVWTGVHGITTLPHSQTGQDIELYLYAKENKKALPVPELFWKVVYNPCKKLGVALLGVNNVYKSEVSEICKNVSNEISWIDRNDSTNIEKGYIYACNIKDFRKTVKSLPEFPVDGLLI